MIRKPLQIEQVDARKWWTRSWVFVTGCVRDEDSSRACENCYARAWHKRMRAMGSAKYQHGFDEEVRVHPEVIEHPLRWRKPQVVFVNSMSDTFHGHVDPRARLRAFEVMAETPQHTYLVLTKRAQQMEHHSETHGWPANVWAGITVEDHNAFARRFGYQTIVQSPVRFISAEPLYDDWILELSEAGWDDFEWFIFGGETGAGTEPLPETLVREVIAACREHGKAVWFKQWGGSPTPDGGMLDGAFVHERPLIGDDGNDE